MADPLKNRLQQDLVSARKGRDKLRTLVLSTILSDIRNKEIDGGAPIDDDGVTQVIARGIKQRKDASTQFRDAGRGELADQEDAQAAVLQAYLPEAMSEEDVRSIVRELIDAGHDQMGPLMGQVMGRIRGRFDGKEANRIVREELQGGG